MREELISGYMLRLDEVLNRRLGRGEPRRKAELRRVGGVPDGADGFEALERLADDPGDESGRGVGGDTGADDDGGEAHDAAVDEASAGVFVDEELGGELAHAVGALWGCDGGGGDDVWERAAVDGEGGGEDEFGDDACGYTLMPGDVEEETD